MPYKIGKYPGVRQQMLNLAVQASLCGIRQAYVEASETMAERLEREMLE